MRLAVVVSAVAWIAFLSTVALFLKRPPEPPHTRQEPARLCPSDDEVLQLPCRFIPWEGRA